MTSPYNMKNKSKVF